MKEVSSEGRRRNTRYLNIGCGEKYHHDWVNIDLASKSPLVLEHNILNGLPFADNEFEVLYHSQVLEHLPRGKAEFFMRECFRVLVPSGILRVVVPDLENMAREYLKHLERCKGMCSPLDEANYDWIMLELYDQAVRNESGGDMARYLQRREIINEEYVLGRIGYVGRAIRSRYLGRSSSAVASGTSVNDVWTRARRRLGRLLRNAKGRLSPVSKESEIGSFRLSGEIHQWMYDEFSLARLLKTAGFVKCERLSPFDSGIPEWAKYGLDVYDGMAFDPTSLFMEARKPERG